jgi:hypothetical protein
VKVPNYRHLFPGLRKDYVLCRAERNGLYVPEQSEADSNCGLQTKFVEEETGNDSDPRLNNELCFVCKVKSDLKLSMQKKRECYLDAHVD